MTLRHRTHTTLALAAAGLLALGACDAAGTTGTTSGNTDESTVSYAGFALTSDDQSDDSFSEDADPTPILDEVGDAVDGADEAPTADETDPVPPEPPERVGRTVLVMWGQPVFNPGFAELSEWTGKIDSTVAHVRVLRKIRFEAADRLIPDGDPASVSFSTTTGPHYDGLLLRVVAPRDAATLAGVLRFRTTKYQKSIPFADILDGYHEAFSVDDLGNTLIVATVPDHRCGAGVMRLGWKRLDARGGVFGGKVYGPDGEVSGLAAGLWGQVDGKRRFKGLFLTRDHRFAGVLKGAWTPFPPAMGQHGGVFRGVWTLRGRQVGGVLGGAFRVGEQPGQGTAFGHLLARCPDAPQPCDADLSLPAPPAPDCACGADEENGTQGACACAAAPPSDACVPVEPPASGDAPAGAPAE